MATAERRIASLARRYTLRFNRTNITIAERDQARAERDAMLPVVEAAKAWIAAIRAAGEDDDWVDEPYVSLGAAMAAAVDQMATQTTLRTSETPQDDVPVRGQAELIQRLTERITGLVETTLREELR